MFHTPFTKNDGVTLQRQVGLIQEITRATPRLTPSDGSAIVPPARTSRRWRRIACDPRAGRRPSDVGAAITFVKNVGTASSTTAGTTTTITLGAGAVAAGNSIIVSITMDAVAGAVSVADSASNAYGAAVTDNTNASNVRTLVFAVHERARGRQRRHHHGDASERHPAGGQRGRVRRRRHRAARSTAATRNQTGSSTAPATVEHHHHRRERSALRRGRHDALQHLHGRRQLHRAQRRHRGLDHHVPQRRLQPRPTARPRSPSTSRPARSRARS